jgi:indole-3-glycerol phosphate synthase
MGILETILEQKKTEVRELRNRGVPEPEGEIAPPRGFRTALLSDPGVSVIAEAKKASPSKGLLCPDFDPVALATDYNAGGAAAISVLTDRRFFQGDIKFLPVIREKIALPLLRKDFIVDHIQVKESVLWGADAILLIVAALEDSLFSELLAHAEEEGLDCLVEVHDEYEMERALKADAGLIGVNNRNLKDFSVSVDTTFRLKNIVGDAVPLVSESGIAGTDDIMRLLDAGIAAALIGESLVRADDRVEQLSAFVKAGRR